jgi:hypothetical protein
MLKMSMSEEWQAAGVHRAAGLAGQLNLETVVQDRFKTLPWMRRFLEELEI